MWYAHTFSIIEVLLSAGLILGSLFMPKLQDNIGWLKLTLLGIVITGIGLTLLHFARTFSHHGYLYDQRHMVCHPGAGQHAQTLTTQLQGRLQSFYVR